MRRVMTVRRIVMRGRRAAVVWAPLRRVLVVVGASVVWAPLRRVIEVVGAAVVWPPVKALVPGSFTVIFQPRFKCVAH
jgi:hypothetical protein